MDGNSRNLKKLEIAAILHAGLLANPQTSFDIHNKMGTKVKFNIPLKNAIRKQEQEIQKIAVELMNRGESVWTALERARQIYKNRTRRRYD